MIRLNGRWLALQVTGLGVALYLLVSVALAAEPARPATSPKASTPAIAGDSKTKPLHAPLPDKLETRSTSNLASNLDTPPRSAVSAPSASKSSQPRVLPKDGFIVIDDGGFRPVSAMLQEPIDPMMQTEEQLPPPPIVSTIPNPPITPGPGAETTIVPDRSGSADLIGNLSSLQTGNTIEAQRRSPISFDPNIRGFRGGQVFSQADGAFWTPARPDLDSVLSKLDANMIEDVTVISGPYGVRLGPGFSFIDITTKPTPRYNGSEQHYRVTSNYQANGAQMYARETAEGGNADFGYRISSGQRRGADYYSGSPGLLRIPGSYRYTDVNVEFGWTVGDGQRIEFKGMRVDQGNSEYAAQFFDLNFLTTDSYNLQLIDEDPLAPWTRLKVEGWYNQTRFAGDNYNKRNNDYPVINRLENAIDFKNKVINKSRIDAATNGQNSSTGTRASVLFGEEEHMSLLTGCDFRNLGQGITEDFAAVNSQPLFSNDPFSRNQAPSRYNGFGSFIEWTIPSTSYFKTTIGARVDWIQTSVRSSSVRADGELAGTFFDTNIGTYNQTDTLYAFYVANTLEIDSNLKLQASGGHSQRPPTLLERYADSVFVGVAQNSLSSIIGNPNLKYERNWQLDLGLTAEYDNFRGRLQGYNSWVLDYISYDIRTLVDPAFTEVAPRQLLYRNAGGPVNLYGFETSGEWDLTSRLQSFGGMRYTQGYNTELKGAIPGIYPLDSQLGLRWHDPNPRPRWSMDTFVRIVNSQNRLGVAYEGGQAAVAEQQTPGFTTWNFRTYYQANNRLRLTAGIDNILNRRYLSHLDLRLTTNGAGAAVVPSVFVYAPGISPYAGLDWTF